MIPALLLGALAASPGLDAGAGSSGPFAPGERLSYEVTVLGAPAGTAQLEVGAATPAEGVSTWPIIAEAQSGGAIDKVFRVRDRDVAWWDPAAGRPVATRLGASEGHSRFGFYMRFAASSSGVAVDDNHWDAKGLAHRQLALPAGAQDFLSALFWLRTRPLAPGERDTVSVYMGSDVWPLAATVVGRETVTTPVGALPCVHLVLGAHMTGLLGNRRNLDAWFSDDPRHLPVLLDSELFIGHLRAILTKIEGAPAP